MTAKPRHVHGRQQHVVDETSGVGYADGEGADAVSAEGCYCPGCFGEFLSSSSNFRFHYDYAVLRHRVTSIGHRLLVPHRLRYSGITEVHDDFGLRGIVTFRRQPPPRRHQIV